MAHAAPSSGSSSHGRHAQPDPATSGDRSEQGPTGPSGVPQRVQLEEHSSAENAVGWMTALIGAVGIGVVIAIVVVLVIGVVQRG